MRPAIRSEGPTIGGGEPRLPSLHPVVRGGGWGCENWSHGYIDAVHAEAAVDAVPAEGHVHEALSAGLHHLRILVRAPRVVERALRVCDLELSALLRGKRANVGHRVGRLTGLAGQCGLVTGATGNR